MAAICGILGKPGRKIVEAMAAAMRQRGVAQHIHDTGDATVASSAPFQANAPCLVDGTPRGESGAVLTPAALRERCGQPGAIHVRGAFAAALNLPDGRWRLLRSRLGERPLYYYQGPDFLLFASELKGLLASGLIEKRLNLLSVDRYLSFRCVPAGESIIQGVRRVRPGRFIEYGQGQISEKTFSEFDFSLSHFTREEAALKLRALLAGSVAQGESAHLLFSSGVDSAAILALAPHLRPLFVTLERAWQDEARQTRESARLLKQSLAREAARRLTEETFYTAVQHLDEPVADPTVFPLWAIAEAIRPHAAVFSTGHGADELLGGYPRYHLLQRASEARRFVPSGLLSGLEPALPPNVFLRRGSHYLASIRKDPRAVLSLITVFDEQERQELYTEAMKASAPSASESSTFLGECFQHGDVTRNLMALDLEVSLPDLLLAKCDRIAAAHGLRFEYPYLSDSLVDFAVRLPTAIKYGVRGKPLLRLAMKGYLPGRVRLGKRRDFAVPQSGRLARLFDQITARTITPARADATGLFKWQYVEQIVRAASHNVYRRRQFWALLMFFAWYKTVMENP